LHASENGVFEFNAFNPLEFDLLIIDEASMIENKIFARLLEAASLTTKIVFVGDENQLPSVGYGEVFANLLAINPIPKMHLLTVHRQAEGNGIIELAYKVLNNQIQQASDFNLPNITTNFNESDQLKTVATIFQDSYHRTKNLSEIQVITSFYKGNLGINQVNQTLQNVYQNEIQSENTEGLETIDF
jgi:exodeoxyribonuclease V alpha subunit